MSRWIHMGAALALATACGNVGENTGDDGGAATDAQPSCDLSAPFGTPVELTALNSTSYDFSVRPTATGLTVFLGSARIGGNNDIFESSRASLNAPFAPPTPVPSLDDPTLQETSPIVSADGLTIYFDSTRGAAGDREITVATRSSLVASFGTPMMVANVNSPTADVDPFVTADGTTLYFASDRNGSFDLFRAVKGPSGAFGTPAPIGELNSAGQEWLPVLSSDELTIYFHRDNDIWTAHRSSKSDGFGSITRVVALSSPGYDAPSWISEDGCEIWFASDGITGSTGSTDLFVAHRP